MKKKLLIALVLLTGNNVSLHAEGFLEYMQSLWNKAGDEVQSQRTKQLEEEANRVIDKGRTVKDEDGEFDFEDIGLKPKVKPKPKSPVVSEQNTYEGNITLDLRAIQLRVALAQRNGSISADITDALLQVLKGLQSNLDVGQTEIVQTVIMNVDDSLSNHRDGIINEDALRTFAQDTYQWYFQNEYKVFEQLIEDGDPLDDFVNPFDEEEEGDEFAKDNPDGWDIWEEEDDLKDMPERPVAPDEGYDSDSRNSLLDQIRAGKKLRSASDTGTVVPEEDPNSMKAQMVKRRKHMNPDDE